MNDEHDNGLLTVPIDPDEMRKQYCRHMNGIANREALEITNQVYFPSSVFIVLQEIGRVFCEGTKWNKKARIVFEYDPEKKKMCVSSLMESAELDREEDQESR